MKELEDILKVRRDIYAFLARMYLEGPPLELAEDLVNGRFFSFCEPIAMNRDMKEGLRILKEFAEKYDSASKLYEELQDEYVRLFIGPEEVHVLPYESKYTENRMAGKALIKAKRAYVEAGIGKSKACPELEDHIALELAFMEHLCKREIESEKDELSSLLYTQRDFLNRCLLGWVPALCEDVLQLEHAHFYKGVAKMTLGFLSFEGEVIEELMRAVGRQ